MDYTKKISAVLKLLKKSPKNIVKGTKCFVKEGAAGLARGIYEASVKEDIVEWDERDKRETGSIDGSIAFSVVMPVYNVNPKWLIKAIDSVENQIYSNWELILVDDSSSDAATKECLDRMSRREKIETITLESNSGISAATNEGCSRASGDYVVFMDNDDFLSRDALLECYYEASSSRADVIYSDQDEITVHDKHTNPLYKPDWSPELLLSQMYIGHLLCVRRSLLEEIGGLRSEFDGSQDYDLMLRISEKTNKISHISKILYSWRSVPSSTAASPSAKPYAQTAGLRAIEEHLDRTLGHDVATVAETDNHFVYDVEYATEGVGLVSIIIPTKDHVDDLQLTIDSILEKTKGIEYEILVMDNMSVEQATLDYFNEISAIPNIQVIPANYEFNWSKINNHGIRLAKGDVFVFLNNDVIVLEENWLKRLAGDASQDAIGAVGGLLLYLDGTIQHAGVVVGMGGWADHVYKNMEPKHHGSPFISPMLKRNVSAVTGACMALSRDTYNLIGGFDESFIVCGSDVEICIRAMRCGLRNLYDPAVRLIHFESKTRDANNIPENDFLQSEKAYAELKSAGDPYYNRNLDIMSSTPKKQEKRTEISKVHFGGMVKETRPIHFRVDESCNRRLNVLLPSINEANVFGGASTALRFFKELGRKMDCSMRIIVLDYGVDKAEAHNTFPDYVVVRPEDHSDARYQIVPMRDRDRTTLEVSNDDVFIFTIWWSAFCIQREYDRWDESVLKPKPFIYLIQDYEPGFYPWSSCYMLADSTYRSRRPQIAVFNSRYLESYIDDKGYEFKSKYCFDPALNPVLKKRLERYSGRVAKRKKVIIYGRPGTDRNAFEIIVEGLREWIASYDASREWDIAAAGEKFDPISLGGGRSLVSSGKLSLDEYAKLLSESYAGISLMVSPHPSYPPLEMAAFGVKTITNNYGGKDLSKFSDNIVSLDNLSPKSISNTLEFLADGFKSEVTCGNVQEWYLNRTSEFPFLDNIIEEIE